MHESFYKAIENPGKPFRGAYKNSYGEFYVTPSGKWVSFLMNPDGEWIDHEDHILLDFSGNRVL